MAKKQEQHKIDVGRTDTGLVGIAKDGKAVIIMPPRVALQLAAQVVKHASIIVSGAQMIDDAIAQLEQKLPPENNGDGNITPMPQVRLAAPEKETQEETPPKQET